jgi:hypothetical protein
MRTLFLAAMILVPHTTSDAALEVDKDCFNYANTHSLVRDDVLEGLYAAETNLPGAEASLKQAQADIRALKAAADELQNQKALLQQHIVTLEGVLKAQQAICSAGPPAAAIPDVVGKMASDAWEAVDMPLGFAAGAGMCIGVAWGLHQVTQ